jgi:hypothetical protein
MKKLICALALLFGLSLGSTTQAADFPIKPDSAIPLSGTFGQCPVDLFIFMAAYQLDENTVRVEFYLPTDESVMFAVSYIVDGKLEYVYLLEVDDSVSQHKADKLEEVNALEPCEQAAMLTAEIAKLKKEKSDGSQ